MAAEIDSVGAMVVVAGFVDVEQSIDDAGDEVAAAVEMAVDVEKAIDSVLIADDLNVEL